MAGQLEGAIQLLMEQVQVRARELAEAKKLVNGKAAGRDPIYLDIENPVEDGAWRADQFYGKTAIVAIREFLEMKGRAVTLEEILDGLARGGFDFAAQGWNEELRLRSLGITIGKNSSIFHKLPNGFIGLVKFYPEIEAEKKQRRVAKEPAPEATASDVMPENAKAANA
jgi:hypothetical protein